MWLHVFGRLKPGVSLAEAEGTGERHFQADLQSFYGATASDDRGRELLNQRLEVRPAAGGASSMRTELSDSLTALMAGVGVLMLIACANPGEPPAGARRRAPSGDDAAAVARGRPRSTGAPTGDGEPGVGGCGRSGRGRRRLRAFSRARPDARRRRPQLRDRLCLRPAGVGLPGRGNRDRRTSCSACCPRGRPPRPIRQRLSRDARPGRALGMRANSLGARAGQPATRAVLAASRWRRQRRAPTTYRDRSCGHDRASAPRSRRARRPPRIRSGAAPAARCSTAFRRPRA